MNTTPGPGPDAVVRPVAETLPEHECWELLSAARFGRLAVAAAGDIDIFPVNFVVDGHDLVFRTAEGTKLVEAVVADKVAIESDHRNDATGEAWSVVVKGEPALLDDFPDIYRAQELGIQPWVETPKERFVRVRVTRISGRKFHKLQVPGD